MAIKQANRTFNGTAFATASFPGRQGQIIHARVVKVLAPLIGGLAALAGSPQGDAHGTEPGGIGSLDIAALGPALAGLASVNPVEFGALSYDLLTHTTIGGVPAHADGVFDSHFACNYGELYKVMAWVVEFNFGSVFGAGGISSLIAKLKKPAQMSAPENSQTT